MKRLLPMLLLLAVLLAGCAATKPGEGTTAAGTLATTAPSATDATLPPLEASDTYRPNSTIESSTGGAVRVFDTGRADVVAIYPMGEDLLLQAGLDSTELVVLRGEGLATGPKKALNCCIPPSSATLQVTAQGVTYYDEMLRTVVFLDTDLQETRRVKLSDDAQGNALVCLNTDRVFYTTPNTIRVLDLHTGLTRVLKEHAVTWQNLMDLYFDGKMLSAYVTLESGEGRTVYLSTESGQTVYDGDREVFSLETGGEEYLTSIADGSVTVWLTGVRNQEPRSIRCSQDTYIFPLQSADAMVACEDQGYLAPVTLEYLDLTADRRTSRIVLDSAVDLYGVAGTDARVYLLLGHSAGDSLLIGAWDPAVSLLTDGDPVFQPHFTAGSPDADGLAACQTRAGEIGEVYGVKIHLWQDAVTHVADSYTFTPEYQTAAYARELEALEQALSRFPEGFLAEAASGTSDGMLNINLVRAISGDPEQGSLPDCSGVQYWADGNAYIAIALSSDVEQTFFHELCHVLDNRVIGRTVLFDDWESLNPYSFTYDYNYISNQYREGAAYLEGEDRAFVDTYSMSYPKEDRARILEYAMLPDSGGIFASETMQRKLERLCRGIREAFELDGSMKYLWEQHLAAPLEMDD